MSRQCRGNNPGQHGQLWPVRITDAAAPARWRDDVIVEVCQFAVGDLGHCWSRAGSRWGEKETRVKLLTTYPLQHVTAHAVLQLGFELRSALYQAMQKATQANELGVDNGADAQFATQRAMQCESALLEGRHGGQGPFRGRQQGVTVGGQGEPLRTPPEQGQPQRFLQALEFEAYRRLGQVKMLRGA